MNHYSHLKDKLSAKHPKLELSEGVALAPYTTFKIGGCAPLVGFPSSLDQLVDCITMAPPLPYFIMGNGSNLLISDQGVDRFVIHTKKLNQITLQDNHTIVAQSGVLLSKLAKFAADNGLSGLEFAHGIPGSLGGAITMNAGAYGGEMCDVVISSTALTSAGDFVTRTHEQHDFSYRHSTFSNRNEVVVEVTLQLTPRDSGLILDEMNALSQKRREKQPIHLPSAGSTFKRPLNQFAAALIDQCGLKGASVGGATVSDKHAGFIVNSGGATCQDVLDLVAHVKRVVLEQTKVELTLEVLHITDNL